MTQAPVDENNPADIAHHAHEVDPRFAAIGELNEYWQAGLSSQDIMAYAADHPELSDWLAINEIAEQASQFGLFRARQILKTNRAHQIPAYAQIVGDKFRELLGRPITFFDIFSFAQSHTLSIALTRQSVPDPSAVNGSVESGLCNQVSCYLLALCNKDSLNVSIPITAETSSMRIAMLRDTFPQLGLDGIDPTFFAAKTELLSLIGDETGHFWRLMRDASDFDLSEEQIREMGERNRAFAHNLQKIRGYDIKPIAMDMAPLLKGVDAIYDESSNLDLNFFHGADDIFAIVRLTQQSAGDERFKPTRVGGLASKGMSFHGTHCVITVDTHGELFIGLSPLYGGVPLKTLFDHEGQSGKYEILRASLLNDLFAAIAPATIVERLEAMDKNTAKLPLHRGSEAAGGDAVYPISLPRFRYVEQRQKDIAADFDDVIASETAVIDEAEKRHVRDHDISAHFRKLSPGQRASKDAIERFRKHWPDRGELPEGYTFVKRHEADKTEQGSQATKTRRGRVIGHTAVSRARKSKLY